MLTNEEEGSGEGQSAVMQLGLTAFQAAPLLRVQCRDADPKNYTSPYKGKWNKSGSIRGTKLQHSKWGWRDPALGKWFDKRLWRSVIKFKRIRYTNDLPLQDHKVFNRKYYYVIAFFILLIFFFRLFRRKTNKKS